MKFGSNAINNIKDKAICFNENIYEVLLNKIGNAQIVLLGEATHGTHEFYDIRAEITKKLIEEKGFNVIAIEGDWPDSYKINQYINSSQFKDAKDALDNFDRFPKWMWANKVILQLIDWLKIYNQKSKNKVNFYGLDLYSLYRSINVIIDYLNKVDPNLAKKAKLNYLCFDQFHKDPQNYGYAVLSGLAKDCENEVINQLVTLQDLDWKLLKTNKNEVFNIIQNALVVKNSEEYYRSLFFNEINNWNLRDSHMFQTLDQIMENYRQQNIKFPKIVVWAHNSHIGNAKATQMSLNGEYNIGQLVKEKYPHISFNLGFTTYNGTVSAASDWHGVVERKIIRNALPESYENLFHQTGLNQFLLSFEDKNFLPNKLLERAIGVIYAPQTERQSHYFYASIEHQFDAIIHIDKTTALEPLEKPSVWINGEVPETYPTGF